MIRYLLSILILLWSNNLQGQVTFTAGSLSYNENFNGLANTGTANAWTDNSTITGWYSTQTDYDAGTGSSNSGAQYSFGSTSAADRALGSVASGSTGTIIYGVRFVNSTGDDITSLSISFTGEQWRRTNSGNTLSFSYQVGATAINSGTWISDTNFDFTGPQTGGTTALDGNLGANQTAVSGTLNTLVTNGTEIWIRWSDPNDSGSDQGLSIDDLTVTASTAAVAEPTNHATTFATGTATNTTIPLTWVDATGAVLPHGYLIKASTTSYAAIVDPVDGTAEANSTLVQNASFGSQAVTFTGLSQNTTYFFQIYPYTNSGSNIDYKTNATIPQASTTTTNLPNAWINEFHYDDAGGDANEFVEIVIENAGTYTLADFTVTLYNGSTGASYSTNTVNTFTAGTTSNGFTHYSLAYGSIQNGSPDGIALSYQGSLILFISYEGTFAATDGDANGITSTDIGVSESNSTAENSSLYLTGTGSVYSDYTWTTSSGSNTEGAANSGQVLPVVLTSFNAHPVNQEQDIQLTWVTASEINNDYFEVQRSIDGSKFNVIGIVGGNGTTNNRSTYSYLDVDPPSNAIFYRLRQVDFDGQFEYSAIISTNVYSKSNGTLHIYPNPAKSRLNIYSSITSDEFTTMIIRNLLGQVVLKHRVKLSNGVITFPLPVSMRNGTYIVEIPSKQGILLSKFTKTE